MTNRNPIIEFQGAYRWLSNFVSLPVWYDGLRYPTVEHAYQAAKTDIDEERQHIRNCRTPGDAKRAGRTVTISSGWDAIKLLVMGGLLQQKFRVEPYKGLLLATGDASIVHGNNWGDRYWGVCNGVGDNHLGQLIMLVRAELAINR